MDGPHTRLRGALQAGQADQVHRYAAQLEPVSLSEALLVCLVVRDRDPGRYEQATTAWISAFALAARSAGGGELRLALNAFETPPTDLEGAMERLSRLYVGHGVG